MAFWFSRAIYRNCNTIAIQQLVLGQWPLGGVSHITAFRTEPCENPHGWPMADQSVLHNSSLEVADFSMAICSSWVLSHLHLHCPIPPWWPAGSCLALETAQLRSKSACCSTGLSTKPWVSSMVRVTWFALFPHKQVLRSRSIPPGLARILVLR